MLRLLIFLLVLCIAACQPEPTPFPVDVPVTPTPTLSPTEIAPLRYALAPNVRGAVTDLEQIRVSGSVEQLTEDINAADLGTRYDVVMAFGDYAGWVRSGIVPQVMLVIDPTLDPLQPELANIIKEAVNAQAIVDSLGIPGVAVTAAQAAAPTANELRRAMANLGKPDGFRLALAYAHIPGVNNLAQQLNVINVETRLIAMTNNEIREAFENGRIHMALVTWITAEQREAWQALFGAEFAIELYNLPISYQSVPEVTISLTAGGWPIARR